MKTWQEEQNPSPILRHKQGDAIRVVQGFYKGRTGTIFAIYPTRDRPYVVKLGHGWYVHLPEDVLAPADQRV